MCLQDRNVPQHAIAVMAHFLRLEKLTGFRWSPSSNSTYNRNDHHFGPEGKKKKKTNIDVFLAFERLFRRTYRTIVKTQTHFTELVTGESTIQLLLVDSRQQARFSNMINYCVVKRWIRRYFFCGVSLGVGIDCHLPSRNRRKTRGYPKMGFEETPLCMGIMTVTVLGGQAQKKPGVESLFEYDIRFH